MGTETAVKDRPLLMNGEMVCATLEDRKTNTRRIMNPQPLRIEEGDGDSLLWFPRDLKRNDGSGKSCVTSLSNAHLYCPYGTVGDRLWIRESFWNGILNFTDPSGEAVSYWTSDRQYAEQREKAGPLREPYVNSVPWMAKRPSIHMPRRFSRINLEITGVRVERLKDISEADAIAEGLTPSTCASVFKAASPRIVPVDAYYAQKPNDGEENEGWLCRHCAEKFAGKKGYTSWGVTPETDGPAECNACGWPLIVSLTDHGIESYVLHDGPAYPLSGNEAAIAHMVADGIGDLREKHHGRLAQLGFSTLWESINGAGSWATNPWVWVVEFKRLIPTP